MKKLKAIIMRPEAFGEVERVRCESETRGEIETKGVEDAVVCESKHDCGKVMNLGKGKEGPDESKQRSSPDNEGKMEQEGFETCGASGGGQEAICNDLAGHSTVVDSSEARRGISVSSVE
jgi:hypothetical protein